MKRIPTLLAGLIVFASPAFAITEFDRQWKAHYLTNNNNAAFVAKARKAGCYICHVKGETKEVRNDYGIALSKYLDANDFPKPWVKANPKEAKQRIDAAIRKVEEDVSKDKQKYGAKIKNGDLPSIDPRR